MNIESITEAIADAAINAGMVARCFAYAIASFAVLAVFWLVV